RRRHTRCLSDWSSDVCSSDLCVKHESHVRSHGLASRYLNLARVFRQVSAQKFAKGSLADKANPGTIFFVEIREPLRSSNFSHFRSEERRVGKEGRYCRGME